MPLERTLQSTVAEDLDRKMVWLAGPRQCGKTTLAKALLHQAWRSVDPGRSRTDEGYFNWDVAAHRQALQRDRLPADAPLWVFDELHKYRRWRNWLKGVYDLHHERHSMLVTGSARLSTYRRGGDSLQGRYFLHRMHPVSLAELNGLPPNDALDEALRLERRAVSAWQEALEQLWRRGGFPEPLLASSGRTAARWRLSYGDRLIREDIRDLERIRDLDQLELLFDRLPQVVGSLLSVNALREDLEVAFETLDAWLRVLDNLYAIFFALPYGAPRIRAVKKSRKLYFWDVGRVEDAASRGENLVMLHLLKLTHFIEDQLGEPAELRFFRDAAGHEVDAVVLRKRTPWLAVEIKTQDRPLDRGLRYLLDRVPIRWAFQVSLRGDEDRMLPDVGKHGVRLCSAAKFLAHLP